MDILMTAVRRPEVIKKTLASFADALDNYAAHRLIINIDPVGGSHFELTEVFQICKSFFKEFLFRSPSTPSFPKAFQHCWEKSESDIVFMLEDDWELIQNIDVQSILDTLNSEPDLALLRLPMFQSTENQMKNWNKFFPWNGKYFECPDDQRGGVGFCGHPSFIKKEFIRNSLPFLSKDLNPEKQFHSRGSKLLDEVMKWSYGVWGKPNSPPTIIDIGRPWIAKTKWQKSGNKAHFTKWEQEAIGEN